MLKGFLTESYYITLICPEVDGRGRHGVGKARDGYQRSGSAEPGQLVIQVQPREQGRQKHQAHGGGGGGIDVTDVDAVFNYDVPPSNEYYTHRIGRTGRTKKEGKAYILCMKEDRTRVRDMLRYTRNTAKPIAFNENGELVDAEF